MCVSVYVRHHTYTAGWGLKWQHPHLRTREHTHPLTPCTHLRCTHSPHHSPHPQTHLPTPYPCLQRQREFYYFSCYRGSHSGRCGYGWWTHTCMVLLHQIWPSFGSPQERGHQKVHQHHCPRTYVESFGISPTSSYPLGLYPCDGTSTGFSFS